MYSDNLAEKLWAEKNEEMSWREGFENKKKKRTVDWEKFYNQTLQVLLPQGIGQNLRKADVQINTKTI